MRMDKLTNPLQQALSDAQSLAVGRDHSFIGGKWTKPKSGQYFENVSPTSGKIICEMPRSNKDDVELARDAAHAAAPEWGRTGPAIRANILLKIADRIVYQFLNIGGLVGLWQWCKQCIVPRHTQF